MRRVRGIMRYLGRRVRREDVTELAGLGLVVAGVGQIYEPAAIILAGIGCIAWAQGRGRDT